MRIEQTNKKINFVMALNSGDVFKYCDYYFVAGDINVIDNCRECFNLTKNSVSKIRHNPMVEYWHDSEAILKLSDKEC